MIVQSNALRFCLLRLPRLSYFTSSLSATRPNRFYVYRIPHRRAYAIRVASNFRRDTILEDSQQKPACTCWSLLSRSSSVIASNLPALKLRKAKLTPGKTPLVVLLVTPAHIRMLDDDSGFIRSLFQTAVEKAKPWQEFDLLAAVVDRIPQTSSASSYTSPGSCAADAEISPETRAQHGSEGISVAILDSKAAAPDLWSLKDMSNEQETMTIQQRCTLSFSLPPNPSVRTQIADNLASQPLVERMLQLPVANTVFHNGRTSTLFAQRWVVSFRTESPSEHMSSAKTWLPQQTVHMDTVFVDEGKRLQLDTLLHSPLLPITPARTVTAAVGNIVRKISGGDASAESAPASEELERAITTAIEQGQIPAQHPNVWALVRPQRYAGLDRLVQSQSNTRDMTEYAVLSGARLHKVLSGGGGWGEKQGLLALDPDSDYSRHHAVSEPSFGNEQDAKAEHYGSLGAVARPGDVITFYVYGPPSDANRADLHAPAFRSSGRDITATLTFGSLPSTMDAIDLTEAEGDSEAGLTVEENNFGMLSEQGISLESSFLMTNITANRIQYLSPESQKQVYKVRRRKTVTTKLDAPYTTFAVRGRTPRMPVSSEVNGLKIAALNVHLQDLMPPESSTATAATKPAPALVEKLPKNNDQNSEAQRLVIQRGAMKQNNRDEGRTDGDSTLPIRFTIPEQGPDHRATLQLETQDASPVAVRRHLCASPEDLNQRQITSSVSIVREESEGKRPGVAHEGEDGNIFVIRKHLTMNPYERLKEIQRVGDISSRDQAMGLHSQYHLTLDKSPNER